MCFSRLLASSPPPHYNFAEIPLVSSREPMWAAGALMDSHAPAEEPVMPSPSIWPILTALGINLTWILVMTRIWWVPLIGLALTAVQPAFRD